MPLLTISAEAARALARRQKNDAPDRRVPVGGRVQGHLCSPEAVALQDEGAVAEHIGEPDVSSSSEPTSITPWR